MPSTPNRSANSFSNADFLFTQMPNVFDHPEKFFIIISHRKVWAIESFELLFFVKLDFSYYIVKKKINSGSEENFTSFTTIYVGYVKLNMY